MILPITLTYAAAAALLNVWLGIRVSRLRVAAKVMHGDGGHPLLQRRMRAQANFVEYTPFVLILMSLIEAAYHRAEWLWWVGAVYMLARIAHAFGMDRDKPSPLRAGGIAVTLLALLGLAIFALIIPYRTPAPSSPAGSSPAGSSALAVG